MTMRVAAGHLLLRNHYRIQIGIMVTVAVAMCLVGRATSYSFQPASKRLLPHGGQSSLIFQKRSLTQLWATTTSKNNNNDSSPSNQHQNAAVFTLLNGVVSRAERTLSYKSDIERDGPDDVADSTANNNSDDNYKQAVQDSVENVLSTVRDTVVVSAAAQPTTAGTTTPATTILPSDKEILDYGNNPTVTTTALAHSLWSYVLRPGLDTAIDATAGNGGDSVALAQMLFSNETTTATTKASASQLICIDIQQQACENTRQQLASILPANVLQDKVTILHQSHAPLYTDAAATSVALVVYNLGFLPNSQDTKDCMTTAESSIASMADAVGMLRVGGLLSVMTYPRTNQLEDFAVHAFLEGLALFSSKQTSWETFIDELDCPESLRTHIQTTLQRAKDQQGDSIQKWRVHEHKKLGWVDAPILLTATRIL